jgi:hypothetical protein
MRTFFSVTTAKVQPRQDILQVLSRQVVVGQYNIEACGIAVAKAESRQAVVKQHNVRALL